MIVTKVPRQVFHTIVSLFILLLASIAHAQITLDGTLGTAGALSGPNFVIPSTVGQTRGSNLFHSFGLFSVQTNQSATFTGPNSISNIFGRVTGGQQSTINGTLRSTIPNANLFLLNPAGVLFGPNARLSVGGSFHATTADYLKFTDGAKFHADLALASVLTTAPVSAFGFLSPNPAAISIQKNALQLLPGNTLSLVGGNINIVGDPFLTVQGAPTLSTFGGKVQLASVASPGEVPQNIEGLNSGAFERLGNITLSNAAYVDVSNYFGGPVGNIVIRGGRLAVENSFIFADNRGSNIGTGAGVDIRTTNHVIASNGSVISASAFGSGRGKDLKIETTNVTLTGGSLLTSDTFGPGRGGSVQVTTSGSVRVEGTSGNDRASSIAARTRGTGDAGGIVITAANLNVLSGAEIIASTFGSGKGGAVKIVAGDTVEVDGVKSSGTNSTAIVSDAHNTGAGGEVVVQARNVNLTGGAQISSSTYSAGGGGTVKVSAIDTVTVDGTSANGLFFSGIVAQAQRPQTGDAGNVMVEATNIKVTGGGFISSGSFGSGKGGSVTVKAAETVSIDGVSRDGLFNSGIFVSAEGSGRAGNITVEVKNVEVSGGGVISSNAFSSGNGGTLTILATDTVSVSGTSPFGNLASSIFASALAGSSANAGEVLVQAQTVVVADRGLISTSTAGSGAGGSLTIQTTDASVASGGAIRSSTTGSGDAGALKIAAAGAVSVDGTGSTGSPSLISAATGSSGDAASVEIVAHKLTVSGGAQINSITAASGNAGTVAINVMGTVTLAGTNDKGNFRSGVFAGSRDNQSTGNSGAIDITATNVIISGGAGIGSDTRSSGQGGNVNLVAGEQIRLADRAFISATSSGSGNAGDILIRAREFHSANSSVSTLADFADGGNIDLKVGKLVELVNSQITTSVQGGLGQGGNITIDPQFVILNNSQITANAFGGPGGRVTIIADNFLASPDSTITASSALSTPGTVDIQAPITDLSGSLAPLPESIVQATSLLRQSCATRYGSGKLSSLASPGRGGMPFEPGGFMPSSIAEGDVGRRIADASTSGWRTLAETGKRHFSISATCGS